MDTNRNYRGRDNRGRDNRNNDAAENYLRGKISEILNFRKSQELPELIKQLKDYVHAKGRDLTTSQLRNIYGEVKKAKSMLDMQLLRPKMAYVVARLHERSSARNIINFVDEVIQAMKDDKQVPHIQAFVEAIVAYHKYHWGGKK